MAKDYNLPTTTFCVQMPIDYTELNRHFKLVAYTVPHFKFLKHKKKFELLHIAVKRQLQHPYHFFSHAQPEPCIYVLYDHHEPVIDLMLEFLDSKPLDRDEIEWDTIASHLVIKLLQAKYFHSSSTSRFASLNKYYIQAKVAPRSVICLQVEIKGDRHNIQRVSGEDHEFKVVGHATKFIAVDSQNAQKWENMTPYFRRLSPKDGQAIFTQIDPADISTYQGVLYQVYHSGNSPAQLNYHEQRNPENTRGYILAQFLRVFLDYLARYGIHAEQQVRHFKQFKVRSAQTTLPQNRLPTIQVVDNRLNRKTIPLGEYYELLTTNYPELSFVLSEAVADDCTDPILLLQDYVADDFTATGVLVGHVDPYKVVYAKFPHIPKQSININPNTDQQTVSDEYLTYPRIMWEDYQLRFDVCLTQLLLKYLVVGQHNPAGILPGIPKQSDQMSLMTHTMNYMFIRKKTYGGDSYTTVLYYDGNRLQFRDLRNPTERALFFDQLEQYNLDWYDDILEPFKYKYLKQNNTEEHDLKRFDFILAPATVIEIEDLEEHGLYEYDTIVERLENMDRSYPIAYFKIPTEEQHILFADDLDEDYVRINRTQEFYQFNVFLDRIAERRNHISLNELTNEQFMGEIARIFSIEANKNGRYDRRILLREYQKHGKFLSAKGNDVQASSGIWYDDEGRYMVGSVYGLNKAQKRAQRIRKFDVYQSQSFINPTELLQMLAVTFIRHEQYIVYPYFFHLIDMYVDDVLDHQSQEED